MPAKEDKFDTVHRRHFNDSILVRRWSDLVIKVSGCFHSDTFKRRFGSGFTVQHLLYHL